MPFLVATAWGQVDANYATLSGLVVDASELPVAGAIVKAHNNATGAQRETRTDTRGFYRFSAIEPGNYEFRVEAPSVGVSVKNVDVHTGGQIELNVKMALNKSTERISLESTLVSITDSIATHLLPFEVIQDLPINGRRFQDFATLAPTVQSDAASRDELSFLGQRGTYGNVMVDGTDYNEPFFGGIRGSDRAAFAFTVPQSAIQEFQTITDGYSAEYGRSSGGILNALTRSGSDAVHGESFYQIRNQQLSLDNPFGQAALEQQQQFGGAVGGPLKTNKLFWFVSAEGQLAAEPRLVQFAALDSVANNLTPAITPAYDYFRSLEGPFQQTNNAYATLGRLDYQLRDAGRLTLRFGASGNDASNAASSGTSLIQQTNSALSNNGAEQDSTRTGALQWTSVLPHAILNDLRFLYSGERRATPANSDAPDLQAGVIGAAGTLYDLPQRTSDYRLQFVDSLTLQRGLHNWVLGADYSLLSVTSQAGQNQYGSFVLNGSDVPSLLAILSASGGADGNRFDDSSVTYLRQVGDARVNAYGHELAFFAQDEWRAAPRLTVSYGLRWEAQLNPQPATSNAFLVENVLNFPFPLGRVDPTHIASQFNDWAPRLSLAWNVTGSGKTVVRAGSGLFYGQTPLAFYAGPLNNFSAAGGDLSLEIAPLNGQTVYQQFLQGGINLNSFTLSNLPVLSVTQVWEDIAGKPNQFAQSNVFTTSGSGFRNPRSIQLAASIEHAVSGRFTVAYQFNHLNTVHLPRVVDFNVPEPFVQPGDLSLRPFFGLRSGTPRPNPNLGAVDVLESSARSTYTGNTLLGRYRAGRVQFLANYTLSYAKSDDDLEWPFFSTTYFNPYDLKREWGWSSFDIRNQGAGYVIYQAPLGFELAGIFRAQSGLPIDATTGADTSQLLAASNIGSRPLESPGVPFPRNDFRNLGYKGVDIRLLKTFRLNESAKLQFSVEIFNVFNFKNVAFTSSNDFPNNPAFIYGLGVLPNGQTAAPNPGFLQLKTAQGTYNAATEVQQGTPFQAQLGIRALF